MFPYNHGFWARGSRQTELMFDNTTTTIEGSAPRRRWLFAITVAAILAIYSYPSIKTIFATGSTALPAITAPDLGLYLSLGQLTVLDDGSVLNPYYRIRVPADAAGFLKFRLGPVLFRHFSALLGGRLWLALLLWNLIWWGLLCLAAFWLFESLQPELRVRFAYVGTVELMLFNFGMLKSLASAWLSFPSLAAFSAAELPYIRPFSPQVAMPLLLAYVALQIHVLQKKGALAWAAMAALQLLALGSFPYAALVMAGISAVVAVATIIGLLDTEYLSGKTFLAYGLICGLLDFTFLRYTPGSLQTGYPGEHSLIHLDLALLPTLVGGSWVLVGLTTAALAASRRIPHSVKWPLVGLGLTTMVMLLGDAFTSRPLLLLTSHAGYFVHATLTIHFTFLASAWASRILDRTRKIRLALAAVIVLTLCNGLALAEGTYRRCLPENLAQADLARWMRRVSPGQNSLIVAQRDTCAWVPLLSEAPVLYCHNAQTLLSPELNRTVHRLREVLYLYFIGKDSKWLENTAAAPESAGELEHYGFIGEVSSYRGEERKHRVEAIRAELLPLFRKVESHDGEILRLFRRYERVWVVDRANEPTFDRAKVGTYCSIDTEERLGKIVVLSCSHR